MPKETHICPDAYPSSVKYCYEDDCVLNKDYSCSTHPHFVFIVEKGGNVKIICESKEIKK